MRDGPRSFSRDSTCPAILRNLPSEPTRFRLPGCHRLWPIVPDRSTSVLVCNSPALRPGRPYNPVMQARRFGLFRVRSPLLAESLLFSFPAGTEMVHFPALPSPTYGFSRRYPGISRGGLPHSEISGSTPVCGSPKLFAAYHVLHRLLAPRHPPYALSSLTFTLTLLMWSENYRLQDIQLSKIRRGALHPEPRAANRWRPCGSLIAGPRGPPHRSRGGASCAPQMQRSRRGTVHPAAKPIGSPSRSPRP